MAAGPASVLIEADGGSRGNPGDAAYGAVLKDARTGETIAERAECIGVATNNVAEYRGLIAGLELYHEHAPGAALEIRMDSKLVVEQMSGRWKIKHPDLRPLASAAHRLVPPDATITWIPRAQNSHADRLLNEALDAQAGASGRATRTRPAPGQPVREGAGEQVEDLGTPTTLVLVRHGATDHTTAKRFSGTGGSDPGLNGDGRAQVRAVADWLAPLGEQVEAVVTSPLRRARESAEIIASRLDREVRVEDGLAEAAFGSWDGLTFQQVRERYPDDLDAWLGSLDVGPGGGESFRDMSVRVRRGRDRLLASYAGRTVLAVTHVTPVKLLVAAALGAPLEAVFRMEVAPASVTVISWFADGTASLRLFNARPTESAFIGR
ncbi:MAG TPA: bifunctional RNase H/acid phosphatase [Nocardioidaceae bacterium]|nr:bifunctional RNase H/acid phosphatase [Nocardioidaceae bacterium]